MHLRHFYFLVEVASSSEVYLFEVETNSFPAARREVLNIPHLVAWRQLSEQEVAIAAKGRQ